MGPRTSSGALIALVLAIGACSSGGAGASSGASQGTSASQAASDAKESTAPGPSTAGGPGGPPDPGHATLTIGDEVWEFTSYLCAFGHEATRSDTFSFTSISDISNDEGRYLYLAVEIADFLGEGRYEGTDVGYDVELTDIQHPGAPEIDYGSRQDLTVQIDGDNVTASGSFDDFTTEGSEEIPGSFEGVCGANSRR